MAAIIPKPCEDVRAEDVEQAPGKKKFGEGGPCHGLGLWQKRDPTLLLFPKPAAGARACAAAVAKFDQHWAQQHRPDPNVKPQTHLVRARMVEGFSARYGDRRVLANPYLFTVPVEPRRALAAPLLHRSLAVTPLFNH